MYIYMCVSQCLHHVHHIGQKIIHVPLKYIRRRHLSQKICRKRKPRSLVPVVLMIAQHRAHQASQQTMDTIRHTHCVPLVC